MVKLGLKKHNDIHVYENSIKDALKTNMNKTQNMNWPLQVIKR